MRQIGAEAVLVAQPAGERLQQPDRKLLLGAAGAANEVTMPLRVGAVPARDAVVEVRVCHVTELLERLEVPVDRRRIDLRVARPDALRDVLRGHVVPRSLQRIQHEPALNGHALATRAQPLVYPHPASVAQTRASCNKSLLRLFAISSAAR